MTTIAMERIGERMDARGAIRREGDRRGGGGRGEHGEG